MMKSPEFNESLHPRDAQGRFTSGGGDTASGGSDKPKDAEAKPKDAESEIKVKARESSKKIISKATRAFMKDVGITEDDIDKMTGVEHLHEIGYSAVTKVERLGDSLSLSIKSPGHKDFVMERTYDFEFKDFPFNEYADTYAKEHPQAPGETDFNYRQKQNSWARSQEDKWRRSLPPADRPKLRNVVNELFFLPDDAPKGLGTRIFAAQVDTLSKMGAQRMETLAGRGKSESGQEMVGYYTWPRLGYDGIANRTPSTLGGGKIKVPKRADGHVHLLDLMAIPEGREWWKKNGVMQGLTFDLTPGSESIKVLEAYKKEKAQSSQAKKSLGLLDSEKTLYNYDMLRLFIQ